jgi:uncharacterized protein YbjT (DUF2867 family)
MYVVTGITGQVGSATAQALLQAGLPVRAVVRRHEKGAAWAAKGCEIATAHISDAEALTKSFNHASAIFLMLPPNYDPEPGFPDTERAIAAVMRAITAARPGKIVFLSTIGAHVAEPTLLNNSKMMETALRGAPVPVCFLRAAWFMENARWDVAAARSGRIRSFLQPLDHAIAMVATRDIGRTAADLLRDHWTGTRIVELEGPRRYSPRDIAAGFANTLGHPVRTETIPRAAWEELFRAQGMNYPMPRIRMIEGFNEGWIDFEGNGAEHRKGTTELTTVIEELVTATDLA